jgi:hypothetical protein
MFPIHEYIPTDKARIGVFVSGGWDSAVLWYLVKSYCEGSGQEAIPFTVPKIDGAEYHSKVVVDTINTLLDCDLQTPIIVGDWYDGPDTSMYVKAGAWQTFNKKLCDWQLFGMTKHSDKVHELHTRQDPVDRPNPSEEDRKHAAWPFEHMTKDETVNLGFQLGIGDIIAKVTHSCTEQDRGRCGECYWCTERAWAFSENNLEDKGKE